MKTGTRIYYTGDQANTGGYGTVLQHAIPGRYTPEAVNILLDEPRFEGDTTRTFRMVPVILFAPGPGRRFWLAEEWDAKHREAIRRLLAPLAGQDETP